MRSQITLSILNMRMRLAEPTKWDSFTVSAQVLLIWVVTPPPPSFSVSWHTFRSTNPPPSPLSTPLMPKEACACMPTGTLKPTTPSPNRLHTHTHTHAQSLVFEFPLKCDRSHLTGDTHTWCYRVRARDSASWVMRDCHSHCLSMLQEGRERNDRGKTSASFFLCHISFEGKRGAKKNTEPCSLQKTVCTCGIPDRSHRIKHLWNTQICKYSHGLYGSMARDWGFCVNGAEKHEPRSALQSFTEICWSQLTNWFGFVIGIVNWLHLGR